MKLPGRATSLYIAGFVLFLVVFAYLELTYTRRVDGTSMLPTLEEGDLVVIQPVSFGDLNKGDVIVYNPPCAVTGASVIHRIIEISGEGVTTKGDNNPYSDPGPISNGPVTQTCYGGKVVLVIPYIERIASLPYGTNYILATIIFVVVIYLELRGRGQDDGEGTKEVPVEKNTPQQTGPMGRFSEKVSNWDELGAKHRAGKGLVLAHQG